MNYFMLWVLFVGLQVDQGQSEIRVKDDPPDYTGYMHLFRILKYEIYGAENPKYEWHHNRSVIPASANLYFGQTTQRLVIMEPTLQHQGIYQIFVMSSWGKIFGREIKVEFTIVGHFTDRDPKSYDVVIGQPFRLPCPTHTFTRNAVYKWGGTKNIQGTWFYHTGTNLLVLDDGTLFFSYVREEDVQTITQKGGISCLLDATVSGDTTIEPSGQITLKIRGTNKTSFGPVLEKIPNKEVVEGRYVILRCIAAGYPTPTYRWVKMTKDGEKNIFHQVNGIELEEQNKLLIIADVRKDIHAGTYKCSATIEENGTKKTVEEQSTLTVRKKPAWVEGSHIKSGNPVILSQHAWTCIATGDPEPEYQWYANTTLMMNQSGRHTIEGGILTFHQVTQADNGMYQCVAKNKYGYEYQTVSMIVKVKIPTINKLDSEPTLIIGKTSIITCQSDAIPSANHHWLYNGVRLEPNKTEKYDLTDTQDLIINNVSKDDAGNYTCVATNIIGRTDGHVSAKIGEITFKTRPKDNLNVQKEQRFELVCQAHPNPLLMISYKWKFQGQNLALTDGRHVWIDNIHKLIVFKSKDKDSGIYECVAYITKPVYAEKISPATIVVRGVPDAPEELSLRGTCLNFKANLSWIISYRSPYNPLTFLLLQWSTSHESTTWFNISEKVNGSSNSDVVDGLHPWSDIRFRLIAINKYGSSEPSPVTEGNKCNTPAAIPKKCPEGVKWTATEPQIIEVTWKEVAAFDKNGPGFHYIVNFRKPNSTWQHQAIPQGSAPRYNITKTGADQVWEFTVQSINEIGLGPNCKPETARSIREAPSLAPPSFTYKEIAPTFVILKWEPMSGEETVLGYKLSYWRKNVSATRSRRTPGPNLCKNEAKPCEIDIKDRETNEYKLDNLLPYTTYTMTLRGYNQGGDGPKSKPLILDTKEATPGPADDVRFVRYGKYIRMTWKSPQQPNGVIVGYIVEIKDRRPKELDGEKMEYLFRNLTPVREYEILIKAKTSAGPGVTVVQLINTTKLREPAISKPPIVEGINEDGVNVTFIPGDGKGGFYERFCVVYKEKGQDDKHLKRTNETWLDGNDRKLFVVVSGLQNDKKYLFATIVLNGNRESRRSEFAEGQPVRMKATPVDNPATPTPIYRQYWFYIIIGLILLLLLVLLLLLLIRRKPKRKYRVSEREKKHATKEGLVEVADELPLTAVEPDDEEPQGKCQTYGPIEPKTEMPDVTLIKSPVDSEIALMSNPDTDSLDDYEGEDDDFSEHGSFIGQYGTGEKPSASQSSLPAFV